MRSQTAPEVALLAGNNYAVFQRVRVLNGSGSTVDYSDWVERITIDEDIDQPTAQATVEFRRDGSATLSLAPLRTDSTLNRLDDGATYSPALDAGRLMSIDVATVAIGATPAGGDWKEVFKGYLDSVEAASSVVTIVARDLGSVLVDRWIETEAIYGYDQNIDVVMQQLIDATLGAGVVTMAVEGAPLMAIRTGGVESQSLMEALRYWSNDQRAWDARYKWDDASSSFKFTLHEPDRLKTVPDRSFTASQYYSVGRLSLDRVDVRNVVTINYPNSVAGYARTDMTTTDATSIARYGRRFFGITEADGTAIDTGAEASLLIGNILLDLKDPKAEMEIEAQFFWPAELGDLYRFPDNDVHFNTDQDWAVTNIRHELYGGTGRTHLQVRGKPSGGFLSWLAQPGVTGAAGGLTPGDAADINGWILTENARDPQPQIRDEETVRSRRGGVMFPEQAYTGTPLYDDTGATPLINTTTKRITADLGYTDGTGIQSLKPAEAGAEVTTGKSLTLLVDRTAPNINYVAGGGPTLESLKPAEAGANVTETRTSADTSNVNGTAAATVKGGALRANAGLDGAGVVAAAVPRVHAIANVPGIDGTTGQVDKATAFDTGELQAGLRDTARGAGTGVNAGAREETTRAGRGGVEFIGQAYDARPLYDSAGENIVYDPTTRYVTPKKIIGSGSTPTLGSVHAFWNGTNTIAGTDTSGRVDLNRDTIGTSSTGVQFRVTFATPYASPPNVLLSVFTSTGGAAVQPITVTPATTYFEVSFHNTTGIGGVGLFYHVIG